MVDDAAAQKALEFELHWHPEPGVLDGLVVMTVLYFLALGPLRKWLKPETEFPKAKAAWFMGGVFTLFLAVGTPIEELGERYLFSVHMIQHVILVYIVPVFFLKGLPEFVVRPFLEMEWCGPLVRFVTKPVVGFILFNVAFYVWHLPGLYEWALRDPALHFLEHATFMGVAFIMWYPLMPPVEQEQPLHDGVKLLYVLAIGIGQTPLFAFLTFSPTVFYPTYAAAPRIVELTPLQDQVLGGVIMKLTAAVVMFAALVAFFIRWYERER